MILIIGGIASGKRSYAQSLGYPEERIEYDLQDLLRDAPLDSQTLEKLMHKDVITCCEVGMGVVPLDANDRAWRELVGRTCCELAARADQVVRMVCGIPVRIK